MPRAKLTSETKHKGISRIEQPERHTVGWYGRVAFQGRVHSKYFGDRTHGGTEAALREALRWRNAKERELGKPRTDRVVMPKSRRNRTGAAGVYRLGNQYVVAWSPEPGVSKRALVSVQRYGARRALARALRLRRQKEREVYGQVLSARGQGRGNGRKPQRRGGAEAGAGRRRRS